MGRMLGGAAERRFTVVRVVWRGIDWAGSPVGWFGRCLSEVGVTVEIVREGGVTCAGGRVDE